MRVQQRYTKTGDWSCISECAALVKTYDDEKAKITNTIAEPDESTLPNSKDGRIGFLGNGDCYSHVDYYEHEEDAEVSDDQFDGPLSTADITIHELHGQTEQLTNYQSPPRI
ncbi:hypothetical protein V8C35DRAFT_282571 [Trichoderma chlorosporum]